MKLIDLVNFFRSPSDRAVIARWTTPPGPRKYTVELSQPPDPERFTFLALGDSGDSAGLGLVESPQDAVARFMAEDAALPGSSGAGLFVLHTGDVVYMTGERRLYDRNFRRPYSPFLTPESTVGNLVFRLPFLPVPGNHDYYDYSGWAAALARMPYVGAGIAALARELFGFQIPLGGSDMGGAYMEAFVDPAAEAESRRYTPGEYTRIPNRYYRFRVGTVDFFGLDSNTLDAPPPSADLETERACAAQRVHDLEKKAKAIAREIRRDERAVERWLDGERGRVARISERVQTIGSATRSVSAALRQLAEAIPTVSAMVAECPDLHDEAQPLAERWDLAAAEIAADRGPDRVTAALEALDAAADACCELLEKLEECFTGLPEGPERSRLLAARDAVAEATAAWRTTATGAPPPDLCARLQRLTASALEVHRHLALERRRVDRQPDDHDAAQLQWLREALDESMRANPDGWRVVFLHQPLYTTIGDHSENADVVGVRENLTSLLRDRVHLVLAGHAHAFEWFQTTALPTTGLVVTGGGGQPWLWRSIMDPRRFHRYRRLYASLRDAGATECVAAGNGPPAPDGEGGALYHYVRVEVTPETLRVVPVGVRRVTGGYRREEPLPVFHVPEFPPVNGSERPVWNRRGLEAVEIRRGQRPRAIWG